MQLPQRRPVGFDLQHPKAVVRFGQRRREIVDLDLAGLHVIGPAQRPTSTSCGVPKMRDDVGEPGITLLEKFEDAAAVVVGDHDGQVVRDRLGGTDQQAGRVVDEGEVTSRAMVRPGWASAAP